MRVDLDNINTRTRMLISGDAGVGKTTAQLSIVTAILTTTTHQVFYFDCDTGAARALKAMMGSLSKEQKERVYYYQTPDWIELRNAYREVRMLWEKGDWVFGDRVDMAWDFIQHYYNSAVLGVDEEELDDVYLRNRLEKRRSDNKKGEKKDAAPLNEIGGTDWDAVKSAYNSVIYDLFNGTGPTRMGINVVCSSLAESRDHRYSPSGKPDARDLARFGVTVRGERNLTSLPDSHILLVQSPLGYMAHTIKERPGAKEFKDKIIDSNFLDMYTVNAGMDIINATG